MPDAAPFPTLFTIRIRISRWWLLLPVTACLLIILGCTLYLRHSYNHLKDWYLGLFPCIYRAWDWPQAFFTPAVKSVGNRYCLAAMVLAGFLLIYFLGHFIRDKTAKTWSFSLQRLDAPYMAALYLFGLAIWLYGFLSCVPAYDEVFSAVNCAGMHPFQTASYYMLPNNHIFFNVLNSILGAFIHNKLLTGRIISGLAFAALIPLLYYWLRSKTNSRPVALLFCMVMMLQFPVWGFAFQGRGYSLYLLCAWASFIFLQRYLQTGRRAPLVAHSIAVIIGFWTVPTFLFWECALAVYLLLRMLSRRRPDWPAIRAQLLAGACVFLALLPVFCFSGTAALMENRYVRADKVSVIQHWPGFRNAFWTTIQYCFSGSVEARNLSYLILFLLPLAILPFIRKSRSAGSVGYYVILWLVFCALEFYMQRFPFQRNLTAHYSLTLAALLLACHSLLYKILGERWRAGQLILTGLCCAAFVVHFARFNRDHIHNSLYFYAADTRYRTLHDAVMTLPAGSRVGVSDEGFYWEFLCQQRGLEASMCMGPSATHYIKDETETLPDYLVGRVEKIKQADEYEIYKVNRPPAQ